MGGRASIAHMHPLPAPAARGALWLCRTCRRWASREQRLLSRRPALLLLLLWLLLPPLLARRFRAWRSMLPLLVPRARGLPRAILSSSPCAPAGATPRVRNAILDQGFDLEPPGVVWMKLHRAGAAALPPLHSLRVQHPATDVRRSAERHEGDEAPARGGAAVRDLEVLSARVRLRPQRRGSARPDSSRTQTGSQGRRVASEPAARCRQPYWGRSGPGRRCRPGSRTGSALRRRPRPHP